MSAQGQTGKRIQDYVYNYSDFLGQGNFSKCYRATNTITQQTVAIKIVALNSLKSRRLEELLYSEIEVLKQLDHPNVLRCHEVFSSNNNCYMITELCNKGDLQTIFRRRNQNLEERQIRAIVADVFNGLSYLGSKNIVHRDLKIANIFMQDDVAKIADFGFAVHSRGIFKDLNIGSPLYMSPEGIHSNLYGPKTDVWAFGVMLYELYHGKTPFSHCVTEEQLKASVLQPLRFEDLKSSIPRDAKELILSCMTVAQEKRPLIQQLQNLTYIKEALKQRQSEKEVEVYSPLRQHLILKNNLLNSPPKVRENQRQRNNFQSVQQQRHLQRALTPQRMIFQGPLNNNSMQLKSGNSYNESANFNQTFSHPFQSPQSKRAYMSPFKTPEPAYAHRNVTTPFQINNNYLNKEPQVVRTERVASNQTSQPFLINSQITFKESVSILHYCRLIFKYLSSLKEVADLNDPQTRLHYALLGTYLLSVLGQMHGEVLKKRVKYEGSNSEIRQKKLNEVLEQYLRKYSQELDQATIRSCNLQGPIHLKAVRESIELRISSSRLSEVSSNSHFIAGQLSLVLLTSTALLQGCFSDRSFSKLHKSKAIQEVLNRNKQTFTYTGYLQQRQKTISLLAKS